MSKMTGTQAIQEALRLEMERDPRLILEGIDVRYMGGAFGQYAGLFQKFGPDRVIDTPISESGYTGMGVGLALSGIPTVAEIEMGDFVSLAFDALVNQAAKLRYVNDGRINVPLVVVASHGAGTQFGAQHSQSIEGWFANVPGLKIAAPTTAADLKGLMAASVRDPDPVLFLPYKTALFTREEVPDGEYVLPLGKANKLKEGRDLTVIAWQGGLLTARAAMGDLAEAGIDAELIDLRTVVPYDREAIAESVSKTGRAMIVHEAPTRGGFGAEIAAYIADTCFDCLRAPVRRVCGANIPFPFGGGEKYIFPQAETIVSTAIQLMQY